MLYAMQLVSRSQNIYVYDKRLLNVDWKLLNQFSSCACELLLIRSTAQSFYNMYNIVQSS